MRLMQPFSGLHFFESVALGCLAPWQNIKILLGRMSKIFES